MKNHWIEGEDQPDPHEYEKTSVQVPEYDEQEISHDSGLYSVGSRGKIEPRGLHPLTGTPRHNSGKPVSVEHAYQDEKPGGRS